MNKSSEGRGQSTWAGPQRGETALSHQATDGGLAESDQASVKVLELHRYAHGLVITIDASATTGDVNAGEALRAGMTSTAGGPGPTVLRFRAHLKGGATASTLDHVLAPATEPEPPYFAALGGPGFKIDENRVSSRQELWLWPTPEPGGLDIEVSWPEFGISDAVVSLEVN
ncbi:hypothetical protein VSH64_03275 [Amycolatopsis rhabdoformis]|uniref:Uncharacterized protein n=1 Tax=Amycolatopsis rhabdoformis TaxID=1448059 RepID=A0ABZ1I9J0_9PSEU|nr:hypothetical protein [Amycolatopsis rhabdoformis]WSE31140.1 hypothetical protein VSH64_03275 [Amycolatopsis rhabdoformis]